MFHVAVKAILLGLFSTFEGLVRILNAIATTDVEQQSFNSRTCIWNKVAESKSKILFPYLFNQTRSVL
jgi:hypothetical protein